MNNVPAVLILLTAHFENIDCNVNARNQELLNQSKVGEVRNSAKVKKICGRIEENLACTFPTILCSTVLADAVPVDSLVPPVFLTALTSFPNIYCKRLMEGDSNSVILFRKSAIGKGSECRRCCVEGAGFDGRNNSSNCGSNIPNNLARAPYGRGYGYRWGRSSNYRRGQEETRLKGCETGRWRRISTASSLKSMISLNVTAVECSTCASFGNLGCYSLLDEIARQSGEGSGIDGDGAGGGRSMERMCRRRFRDGQSCVLTKIGKRGEIGVVGRSSEG